MKRIIAKIRRWADDMQWSYEHPRESSRAAQQVWNYTIAALFLFTILWFAGFFVTAICAGRVARIQTPDAPAMQSEAR